MAITHGALFDGATAQTTLTAVAQADGSYKLTLLAGGPGETAVITATADGVTLTDTASVEFYDLI